MSGLSEDLRTTIPETMEIPRNLGEIDAEYMTQLLRSRGLLAADNAIVSMHESGVGMTAGFFSAIKKLQCEFSKDTDCCRSFVVKAWPDIELLPEDAIAEMFVKDIQGYMLPAESFFPRPRAFLADFDIDQNRWGLVMEDVSLFSEQQVHENELDFDGVMRLIPGLVEAALAWEGCHEGQKAERLKKMGVEHWSSETNLALYRDVMPGGARLFDKLSTLRGSSLVGGVDWTELFGCKPSELFTNKLEAFFEPIRPEKGGTCCLSHGDLRGDNLFFCPPSETYPHGWLTIDFQLMFVGPIPSDLAFVMGSGSVLPEVYEGTKRDQILRAFYEDFSARTKRYPEYSYEQFENEYAIMSTILYVYYVGMGGAVWRAAAFDNENPARVELGSDRVTEAELEPAELRKRMWWAKGIRNIRFNLEAFKLPERWKSMPDNVGKMGKWIDLPAHLR